MIEKMSTPSKYAPFIDWTVIESSMHTFQPASSGYTQAKRGFITLPDKTMLFVKIGSDDATRKWAQKEIDVYQFLRAHSYTSIPNLLSISDARDGFALEYLNSDDNWSWETPWTDARLQATIDAMDALANIPIDSMPESITTIRMVNSIGNPWQTFATDSVSQNELRLKLGRIDKQSLAEEICNDTFLKQDFYFNFPQDTLVHYDVRRDNCAWNKDSNQVKIVDWNWLQIGNRDIDINALLVSVVASSFQITPQFNNRLNRAALLWLAGSWFSASLGSIKENTSETNSLRDYQLQSAITAYELAMSL